MVVRGNLAATFLIASVVYADVSLSQYVIRSWNRDTGLPSEAVTSLAQTPDGYLWLATRAGIVRFDGIKGTLFDRTKLPRVKTNIVTKLWVDAKGVLWAASLEPGLLRYDGNRWEYMGAERGLTDLEVAAFHSGPDGQMWVAPTRGGLLAWDGSRFQRLKTPKELPRSTVLNVVKGSDGVVWIGTAEHGLIRWKGEQWDVYGQAEGLPANAVWGLVRDVREGLWVGSSAGIHRVVVGGRVEVVETLEVAKGRAVDSAYEVRPGEVWWGMFRDGIVRQKGSEVEAFTDANVLQNLSIRAFLRDREGAVWVATDGGLLRFVEPSIVFHAFPQTSENRYQGKLTLLGGREPILSRAPNLIVSGLGTQQKVLARVPNAELNFEIIGSSNDNAIWIRNRPGEVLQLKNGAFETLRFPVAEVFVAYLPLRGGGGLLASRDGRLFRQIAKGWEEILPKSPLSGAIVTLLQEGADGTIWVGTRKGLTALRNGQWREWKMGKGLPSSLVSALYCDRGGRVWVGTAAGLVLMEAPGEKVLDKKSGLPDEAITSIGRDKEENLWLASSNGIFRIAKDQVETWVSGRSAGVRAEVFGKAFGLQKGDGQPFTGSHVSTDGVIWCQMMRGIAEIDPRRIRRNEVIPETKLEAVIVDGESQDLTTAPGPSGGLRLSSKASRVEFQFTALSLLRPEMNRFQYRLAGYEKNWVDAGADRRAIYTNIPGGEYRFEVRGSNDSGLVSQAPAAIAIEKDKKFSESLWMPVLVVGGIAGLFALAFHLRTRQLKYRYELQLLERQRIARELHDGLLQEFTGATFQLAALRIRHEHSPVGGDLEGLVTKLEESLRESRHAIQSLRGREWAGVRLSTALEECAERLCRESGIRWHCEMAEATREPRPEVKEAIWEISRESIRNSVKHSQANEVRIELRVTRGELVLRVEDDGRGFDPASVASRTQAHFGLPGIRERAEQVGGRIAIVSAPGKGCRTELTVPARSAF